MCVRLKTEVHLVKAQVTHHLRQHLIDTETDCDAGIRNHVPPQFYSELNNAIGTMKKHMEYNMYSIIYEQAIFYIYSTVHILYSSPKNMFSHVSHLHF